MEKKLQPRVSVLIPTYNRADLLGATLESIFCQTLPVAQVIVADDGSTDGTGALIQRLLEEHSGWRGRLDYFQQANQGKSVALNQALERATGDWIAFDDSDDLWLPAKLEKQFETLQRFPECRACFGDTRIGNGPEAGKTTFGIAGRNLKDPAGCLEEAVRIMAGLSHGIFMQTVLVRADVMRKVGLFDPDLRAAQDSDFLFRLSLHTPLCYVNAPLVELDRLPERPQRLTLQHPMQGLTRLQFHEKMFSKWQALASGQPAETRKLLRKRAASARSALANQLLRMGRRREARQTLSRALKDRFALPLFAKWLATFCAPAALMQRWLRPPASEVQAAGAFRRA
jgi:glycosyltransferase involved in cell wall biosynthesis